MKTKLLFVILTLTILQLHAQKAKLFQVKDHEAPYHYWCYEPEGYAEDSTKEWPVFIFLHGRSLSGTDLNKVKRYGLIAEIEKGRSFPAIIIAPQVNNGQSWEPDKVIACLDYLETTHRVDSSRIAITGMSLGGYGTLHTAGKYPEKFCAAAAFCGGGNVKDGCNLSTLPVWIAHGTKDAAVAYSESEKMVTAIRQCEDEKLRFESLKGLGHGELEKYFRTEELYDFFLTNKLGEKAYFPKFTWPY
jgi:predicted peptidase